MTSSNTGKLELSETNTNAGLFYIPAFSEQRQQYEVSCIDSSHLLTRTRRKCCKGGLDGLSNKAWREVAKSNTTNLSVAMIDCVIDPMSVAIAVAHFSESVEKKMRENGDHRAADLCRDIRMWWKSEDDPGISAHERIQMRQPLRRRLMSDVNFSYFPPPGMHINGWPSQLLEGIIANIDAKTLLYFLALDKTYNVRAFSSLMGETFFSELTLYDRRGQGTVTSKEFGQFISVTVEKLHVRLDPERPFTYRTTRHTAYKLAETSSIVEPEHGLIRLPFDGQDLVVKDHPFDNKERARIKGKKKEETVNRDINSVQSGSLGVRWESARRNESKLLATTKIGLDV